MAMHVTVKKYKIYPYSNLPNHSLTTLTYPRP